MYTELRGLYRETQILNYTSAVLQTDPGLRDTFLEEAMIAREGWLSNDRKMNAAISRWEEMADQFSVVPTTEASIQ